MTPLCQITFVVLFMVLLISVVKGGFTLTAFGAVFLARCPLHVATAFMVLKEK